MSMPSLQYISQRVRRRLFQNDDVEKEGNKRKRKISLACGVLFVTTNCESNDSRYIVERSRCVTPETKVTLCLPQHAKDACSKQQFNLILTDIDLSRSGEFMKVILAIRNSSIENQRTPIIAIKQSHTSRGKDLAYHEITQTYYGNLMTSELDTILIKYVSNENGPVAKKDHIDSSAINNSPSTHHLSENEEMVPETPANTPQSKNQCSVAVDSQNIQTVKNSGKTANKSRKKHQENFEVKQEIPYLVFKPIAQRFQNVQASYLQPYQPQYISRNQSFYCFGQKPMYPAQLESGFVSQPVYMGNNRQYDIRVNMFEEEHISHSLKERRRRERIKDACNQIRELLPNVTRHTKKIDMARLLEFTVLYIKSFQSTSTFINQEQCELAYQNLVRQFDGSEQRYEISLNGQQDLQETNRGILNESLCLPTNHGNKGVTQHQNTNGVKLPSSNCHFIPISPAQNQIKSLHEGNSGANFTIQVTNKKANGSTNNRFVSNPLNNYLTPHNPMKDYLENGRDSPNVSPCTVIENEFLSNPDACALNESNWSNNQQI